jgi:hypothetical protein
MEITWAGMMECWNDGILGGIGCYGSIILRVILFLFEELVYIIVFLFQIAF